jgi:hypothetical protein
VNAPSFLQQWGPLAGGIMVSFPPWIKMWIDGRKVASDERTDLIRIAQDAAASVINSLQDRVEALEAELTKFREESDKRLASKDAELSMLRGQLRQWMALAEAYERLLETNNIPHEKPAQPFWRVEIGHDPSAQVETP